MLDKRICDDNWAVACARKYQYRIYLTTGEVLSACILSPAAVISQRMSFMPAEQAACGELPGGRPIAGEDWLLFGTADGWVMRGMSASFDGSCRVRAESALPTTSRVLRPRSIPQKLTLELDYPGRSANPLPADF